VIWPRQNRIPNPNCSRDNHTNPEIKCKDRWSVYPIRKNETLRYMRWTGMTKKGGQVLDTERCQQMTKTRGNATRTRRRVRYTETPKWNRATTTKRRMVEVRRGGRVRIEGGILSIVISSTQNERADFGDQGNTFNSTRIVMDNKTA